MEIEAKVLFSCFGSLLARDVFRDLGAAERAPSS